MTDFGNLSWHLYVVLAYVATGVGLASYAFLQFRIFKETVESLKKEGFIDE